MGILVDSPKEKCINTRGVYFFENLFPHFELILPPGHSMSSQLPDGRHVTDFAEILHTIWDMKKNSEPKD